MKKDTKEFLVCTLFYTIIIGLIGFLIYLIIGMYIQNSDVLVKEDSEYLYYKQYTIFNNDSCIYKYHKPIIYEGEIVGKNSHFRGVPGKGGHRVYETTIEYHNGENFTETGWHYYVNHNIGDKVKVYVRFYPYKLVKLVKNENGY